jgi:hypothetical protein
MIVGNRSGNETGNSSQPPHQKGATLALVKQFRKLAREPWLQTGQARLGAPGLRCRGVACEPWLQTGQARLGAWGFSLPRGSL